MKKYGKCPALLSRLVSQLERLHQRGGCGQVAHNAAPGKRLAVGALAAVAQAGGLSHPDVGQLKVLAETQHLGRALAPAAGRVKGSLYSPVASLDLSNAMYFFATRHK